MLLMKSHVKYEKAISPEYQIAKLGFFKKSVILDSRMTSRNVKSPGYESKKPLIRIVAGAQVHT